MARNKKSIQQVDERIRLVSLRIRRDSCELVDLLDKRRKMVTGKMKVPPPPGVKHKIKIEFPGFDDALDDLKARPVAPGAQGPC